MTLPEVGAYLHRLAGSRLPRLPVAQCATFSPLARPHVTMFGHSHPEHLGQHYALVVAERDPGSLSGVPYSRLSLQCDKRHSGAISTPVLEFMSVPWSTNSRLGVASGSPVGLHNHNHITMHGAVESKYLYHQPEYGHLHGG